MQIKIWKGSVFGIREASGELTVFDAEGQVYATWSSLGEWLLLSRRIPVSDELAWGSLLAHRKVCPHRGEVPKFGFNRRGYTCWDRTEIGTGDGYTVEHCDVCGYTDDYRGSPTFRAAMQSGEYGRGVHPHTTYLSCLFHSATIRHADWDERECKLVPSRTEGILHICIPGQFKTMAQLKQKAELLGAKPVYDQEFYSILAQEQAHSQF